MNDKLSIVIIDYGVGNTHSVVNAIKYLDYKVKISQESKMIQAADVLVLPGVGAFDTVMKNLHARNLDKILNEEVLIKKKPILGICAGMQMMASYSEENGIHQGLNWIAGKVIKLSLPPNYTVPHVGWNNIEFNEKGPLFGRLESGCHFYFDHSYHFVTENPAHIAAQCNYGIPVTATVQDKHICGVQFHPEKSQTNGLKLFRSFFNSVLQYA